jgi:feruloyl esterase
MGSQSTKSDRDMKIHTLCLAALVSATTIAFAQPRHHVTLEELRAVRLPDVELESVSSLAQDLQKHPEAKTTVQVKGVIGGTIRFELLLPDEWNGRFVMGGGGGFVGTVQNSARDSASHGFATVGTDTGHQSEQGHLAKWALNNMEAQLNFGYLAVHRTAEVAKALIRAYYGSDPSHSYFTGCSRGGGQAMMESQRYPLDFDGIVAGAPAFDWTGLAAEMVSIAKALYPDPANLKKTVLTKDALQKLQKAILEQCDGQDGLKDGVIQDPGSARFDLDKVEGLGPEQKRAIEAIYNGVFDGQKRISPGFPRAECDPDQWIAWLVGPVPSMVERDHVPDLTFSFGTQSMKYLIFNDPDWDYSRFNFSNYEKETARGAAFLNASDPHLEKFKTHKGKLIIWHGWADPALSALSTEEYYRRVLEQDPGAPDFCRLFMIPGCLHCGGGPGASEVDWLSVIVDWVERNKAPDLLIAGRSEHGKLIMTRPLYPYPETAKYSGQGDPNKAESFQAQSPAKSPH